MKLTTFFVGFLSLLSYAASQEVAEAEAATQPDAEDVVAAEEITTTTTTSDEQVPEATPREDEQPPREEEETAPTEPQQESLPVQQSGPFVDILGPTLLSLEMTSETTATLNEHLTNDALKGKKVVGLYFSADWCGPCRQFTPELVKFYDKVNKRRRDDFQIVWISRCRDVQSYGQYFTEMNWLALPPQEAMGERGQWLGEKYGVKSIPSLVLLDDVGNIITKEARNQIPKDKAGIGFPWRNPLSTLYVTVVPKTLRHMIKSNVASVKNQVFQRLQTVLRPKKAAA